MRWLSAGEGLRDAAELGELELGAELLFLKCDYSFQKKNEKMQCRVAFDSD